LPFVDRAIPVTVAAELGVPVESVDGAQEQSRSGFWALMASMAVVPDYIGTASSGYVHVPSERAMQEKTEEQLHKIADFFAHIGIVIVTSEGLASRFPIAVGKIAGQSRRGNSSVVARSNHAAGTIRSLRIMRVGVWQTRSIPHL
jgi:hypothetical protein